ncbi:carbohydrate ABC transporter membrane protein 1 (CUT1 family) [Actinocorallia herbida]|uniref:Carbohydrate ABC transporter membrane protein 1 (CUT1 family) n=1 Tax=Actinocorallia herbida TaxID=58109 RepID=A0A3N1DAK7_9ACTN|nr:sugar ABC transporter permease [Actinocorallia herbida]ROO90540.1 carbohydrate ABC transporter membrane protein 1 (CUT1 family) [Actinocorallia herbida]
MSAPAGTARKSRVFYVFVLPWVIGFLTLTAFPLAYAFWLSLTSADVLSQDSDFVGAANYTELLHDARAGEAFARTALFTLATVPASVLGGLLLAVLVQRPLPGRAFYRAAFFLPSVVPPVATAIAFKALFARDTGAVNGVLGLAGAEAVTWTEGPHMTAVLVCLALWGVGSFMTISLAALQDVPRDLFDAALVDGAGALRTFTAVTLPLISPVLLFQAVTGVTAGLQTFLPALLLAPGSGGGDLTTMPQGGYFFMIHVYVAYFAEGRFGYASALLWVLFLLTLACTGVLFRLSRRFVFTLVGPGGGRP